MQMTTYNLHPQWTKIKAYIMW